MCQVCLLTASPPASAKTSRPREVDRTLECRKVFEEEELRQTKRDERDIPVRPQDTQTRRYVAPHAPTPEGSNYSTNNTPSNRTQIHYKRYPRQPPPEGNRRCERKRNAALRPWQIAHESTRVKVGEAYTSTTPKIEKNGC